MNYASSCADRIFSGHHRALFTLLAVAALGQASASLGAEATTVAARVQELDEVVVTADMVPGAVVGDIPPENQMSPEDIAARGVSTISDLLDDIADQTQSDQGRDSSAGPIILVNGRRVSGVREVGDLPTESILRLDILPEEVALKYGYGAQQKVVNIILKRDFAAEVANLNASESAAGGGANGTGDLSHTRIHDNDRVNVVGRVRSQSSLLESDRGVSSTSATVSDPTGTIGDDSSARTLKPAANTYTLNGVVAHPLSQTMTASLNMTASYQTNRSLQGYPSASLTIPAGSPFGQKSAATTLNRYLSPETLRQSSDTGSIHAGGTLNWDLPNRWRLSAVGNYDYSDAHTRADRSYDVRALQAAISAGQVSPYGLLPASLLGPLGRQDSTAITNTGQVSVVANGALFALPAGNVATSIRLSDDFSSLNSASTGAAASQTNRNQMGAQVSVDVPLTSISAHVHDAIGSLSVNVNGGVTQASGYGALGTVGYGLHWTPRTGLSVLASVNQDHQVPSLAQLNGPLVTTFNARIYDYIQQQTVTVSRTSGGNPVLKADDRRVFKLGATLAAINTATLKLNVTANYIDSVLNNQIGSLSTATAATEDAFPDRFVRDDSGMLVSVDARPLNFARQETRDVRWGFNLTRVLRASTQATRTQGAGRAGQRFAGAAQGGARNARGGGPGAGGAPSLATIAADGEAIAQAAAGPAPSGAEEGPGAGERPGADLGAGPPNSPDGAPTDGQRGGRPDGAGATAGGPRAAAGGAGAAGGRGGGGGGGRGGGGGAAAGNGAQFDVSIYDSWYFRDEVRLRAGGPAIDLLNGGTIGARGQARHRVQLNSGVVDNGIGLRFTGSWTSPVRTLDSGNGSGALYYSSLATLDIRLFADLQQRFAGKLWAQGTRVTLAITNTLDGHQHIRDGSGATPQIYQPAFLDPYGRTIGLAFRRLF